MGELRDMMGWVGRKVCYCKMEERNLRRVGERAGERRFRREGWRANLWVRVKLLLNSCFSKPMVYVFSFTSGLTVLLDL